MAINFVSWRKSLMKDCVKQCNVPLPSQGEYTRRDYIDAIRDDQRQFKYLATKNNHTLLEIAQRNNTNIRGTGTRGRISSARLKSTRHPKRLEKPVLLLSGDSKEI